MRNLLTREIENEFNLITNTELGTKERDTAITGLTKLIEKAVEFEKIDAERQDKLDTKRKQDELESVKLDLDRQERENRLYLQEQQLKLQEQELKLKEKQHEHDKWSNALQVLATVGIGLAGLAVTIWGTKTTLEYEDKGIIPTTLAGREHTKKLFNKK